MQLKRFVTHQKGDTIVEVLIAIAVISAVVGSGYAITNRSMKSNQQAQEHSQALKQAESQLETLQTWVANEEKAEEIFNPTANPKFCFYVSGGQIMRRNITTPLPATNNDSHPDECKFDDRYMVGITRSGSGGQNIFTVYVNWDGPTGVRDSVSLVYKAYR